MEDSPEALMELKSNVSRETIKKLDAYRTLILAEKQSLISVSYTHLTLPTKRIV